MTAFALPLFEAHPLLREKIAWVQLAQLPTPIKKLETLGSQLGARNLYAKQDNLTNSFFGGNKVRKLEFLLGDALAKGYKGVATLGNYGSNHGCATAIHSHRLGLNCHLFLAPQYGTAYLRRNLLLDTYYGAHLHHIDNLNNYQEDVSSVNELFKKEHGTDLYFIPLGGSNVIGDLGFVNAAFELREQVRQGILPMPDIIYITLSSCGTAAGLYAGCKAAGLPCKIVAVVIEPEEVEGEAVHNLSSLINQVDAFLTSLDPHFSSCAYDPEQITIEYNFKAVSYAQPDARTQSAINLLAKTEQIKLDGTYAGRTFTALLNHLQTDPTLKGKNILFWNTFCNGSFEEITRQVDYKTLPAEFHPYFEADLNPYDAGM